MSPSERVTAAEERPCAVVSEAFAELSELSRELRSIGFLFESQGEAANETATLDMDEVYYGIGQMLNRIAGRMKRIAEELDQLRWRDD